MCSFCLAACCCVPPLISMAYALCCATAVSIAQLHLSRCLFCICILSWLAQAQHTGSSAQHGAKGTALLSHPAILKLKAYLLMRAGLLLGGHMAGCSQSCALRRDLCRWCHAPASHTAQGQHSRVLPSTIQQWGTSALPMLGFTTACCAGWTQPSCSMLCLHTCKLMSLQGAACICSAACCSFTLHPEGTRSTGWPCCYMQLYYAEQQPAWAWCAFADSPS